MLCSLYFSVTYVKEQTLDCFFLYEIDVQKIHVGEL